MADVKTSKRRNVEIDCEHKIAAQRRVPFDISTFRRLILLLILAHTTGCNALYDSIGGGYMGWRDPAAITTELSPGAMALIEAAFDGIDPDALGDMHVHPLTLDMHPYWLDPLRPVLYGRTMVYFAAAGVRRVPMEQREQALVDRLVELIRTQPVENRGRFYLLGMDHYYLEDGTIDPWRSWFVIPNEYVWELAQQHSDIFVPTIPVHPNRFDAIEELERWAAKGVRHVKWIPNSYGFDPLDPRFDAFYETMAAHDMVLLCHTGDEHAFEWDDQEWGNPLRLRRALDHGVKVVAFHAASHGQFEDLDYTSNHGELRRAAEEGKEPRMSRMNTDDVSLSSSKSSMFIRDSNEGHSPWPSVAVRGECSSKRPSVEGFDLLMRMMDDPQYDGLLFAEISAMTFFNHLGRPLRDLIARQDLHHRIVNGSDYPFCAVSVAIQPSRLARHGYLTQREAVLLKEIYHYNPLLYDFVVKRSIRHPETGQRFRPEVFEVPEAIR